MRKAITIALAAAALTSIAQAQTPSEARGAADMIVRNVTVIDPESRRVQKSRDIIIQGGRIQAIVASRPAQPPAATVIDGTGQFAIPGLLDMHSHTSLRPIHRSSLALYHANGVTGVREMGSDCHRPGGIAMCIDEMRASGTAIEAGTLPGPRLLALATMKIQSSGGPADSSDPRAIYFPRNAAEAELTARHLLARKPDLIKIGDVVDPGAYRVLLSAAKAAGIGSGGHLPLGVSIAEAAALGQRTIEHARDLPLDCSTYGSEFRAAMKAVASDKAPPAANPMERAAKAVATQNPAKCRAQIAAMVKFGTYYVPTHLTRAMDYRASDPAYRNDPRMVYVPAQLKQMWTRDLDRYAKATGEQVAALEAFYRLGLRLTGEAHRAGVKVMAGTDSNDTMIFPGFSLHDELGNLVAAGLSPMDALRAATAVPAEYLNRSGDLGGLAKGKLADIVLLRANPLNAISNTTQIDAVIQGGRVSNRERLDAMLAEARASAAGEPTRQSP